MATNPTKPNPNTVEILARSFLRAWEKPEIREYLISQRDKPSQEEE